MNKIIFSLLFIALSLCLLGQEKWTLEECIQYAMENNLSVQLAEKDINFAEVDVKDAKNNRLPNLNANLNHVINIGLSQNLTTGILEDQSTQFSSAGIGVNWTAYNGKRNLINQYRANAALLSSQYQLDNMKDNIGIQVANAYLQVVFNRENLKVLESQLAALEIDKTRISKLIDAGNLPEGEILELEASIAGQEQAIVSARNNLKVSLVTLAQILQLDDVESFDIVDQDYNVENEDILIQGPKEIYEKALTLRNDIKAAEQNIELAKMDKDIARRTALPTVNFFYNYDTRISYQDRIVGAELDENNPTRQIGTVQATGQSVVTPNLKPVVDGFAPIFDQWGMNDGHTFGVQVNVPIFNRFSVRNNVMRQQVSIERSTLQLETTKQDLENAIYQAYYDALNAKETYAAAQKTRTAREKAFEFSEKGYNAGTINSFEYNQSRQQVVQSKAQEIQSKYDYLFRLKVLEFYFGVPLRMEE